MSPRYALLPWIAAACGAPAAATRKGSFPLRHTEAEWRKLLTPAQYYILREEGTEQLASNV